MAGSRAAGTQPAAPSTDLLIPDKNFTWQVCCFTPVFYYLLTRTQLRVCVCESEHIHVRIDTHNIFIYVHISI